MTTTIQKLPLSVRPYERLEEYGAKFLSDAELLAILMKTGRSGASSVEVANELLCMNEGVSGIQAIMDMSLDELMHCKGIGRVKAITIMAALELGRRATSGGHLWDNTKLTDVTAAIAYFEDKMKDLTHEEIHIAILNTRHNVIRHVVASSGGLSSTGIYPREIFRDAIKANAAAIIVAHNHPSGDPEPSNEDIKATTSFFSAGAFIGIDVVDHIIVGNHQSVSMKTLGFIP